MQIASLATKVDALAAQHDKLAESQAAQTRMLVDAADQLKKFVATPAVKVVGGVLFGIFSSWFASHFGVQLPK